MSKHHDTKLTAILTNRTDANVEGTVTKVTDNGMFFTISGSPADVRKAADDMLLIHGIDMDDSRRSFWIDEEDTGWTCAYLVVDCAAGSRAYGAR